MRLSETMIKMHEAGTISDETLLFYGMSGDLPDPEWYHSLEDHEKAEIWSKKMELKLGENWRERFRSLPAFLRRVVASKLAPKWLRDGF